MKRRPDEQAGIGPGRSLRVIQRYGILVGLAAAVGLLAGAASAAVSPVMVTSTALVVLPQVGQNAAAAYGEPDPFTATQEPGFRRWVMA